MVKYQVRWSEEESVWYGQRENIDTWDSPYDGHDMFVDSPNRDPVIDFIETEARHERNLSYHEAFASKPYATAMVVYNKNGERNDRLSKKFGLFKGCRLPR